MTARREKGLCYNRDERWAAGHKCKGRFQCLLLEEEEQLRVDQMVSSGEDDPINPAEEELVDISVLENSDLVHFLSYYAVQGTFVPTTLASTERSTTNMYLF